MPRAILGTWSLALMSAAMLTILLLRPIWDPDIFWQLKLGEMILEQGGPIPNEPFSQSHMGEPLPAVAWLGQVVMASIRGLFGWTGLRVFDAVCWLGGFLILAAACRRRGASASGLICALALAFFVAYPTASIRPQTFAVFGFGTILAMLQLDWKPWRLMCVATPLLLIWQNLHPSVSVAAVALGVYAAVEWLRWLKSRRSPPLELTFVTFLAAVAMFATPDGLSILNVSSKNAAVSVAMGVTEWLPLWHPAVQGSIWSFFLILAVPTGIALLRPRRIDMREFMLFLSCLVLTAAANRFVVFAAIAMIPVISRSLTRPDRSPSWPGFQAPLLLLLTAISTPLQHPTHFTPRLAIDAVSRLQESGASGVIFTTAPWGGPAIDAGHPRWQVAYDGRLYRYTMEEWRFYEDVAASRVALAAIEQRLHPGGFVIDAGWTGLNRELRASPHWQEVWRDEVAVAYKRR